MTEEVQEADSKQPSSARVKSIDVLKGVAMIGIVIAHIALLQNQGGGGSGGSDEAYSVFKGLVGIPYSLLCMFFVVSGYFYKPGNGYWHNVKDRVLKLFLFFVASVVLFTSLMYAVLWAQGYDLSSYSLIDVIVEVIIGKGYFVDFDDPSIGGENILAPFEVTHPLYFLQIIMVGYLIFYAIADYVMESDKRTVITIAVLLTTTALYMEFIHIQLPFSAQLGPLVASYLLMGTMLRRKRFYENLEFGHTDRRYWKIFLISLAIAVILCALFPSDLALIYSKFGDYGGWSVYPFFISMLFSGIVMSYIISWVVKGCHRLSALLAEIGVMCLFVHVSHMFIAKAVCSPFVTLDTEVWIPISLPAGIVVSFVAIAIAMVASELLFGRWSRRARRDD